MVELGDLRMGGSGGVGGGGTESSRPGPAGCCQSLSHPDQDGQGRGEGPEEALKAFI